MSVFATIIVSNKNQPAAQALTDQTMFQSLYKKGLRKYWISSGNFPQDYFNALTVSGIIFAIETNKDVKPTAAIAALGMVKVTEE